MHCALGFAQNIWSFVFRFMAQILKVAVHDKWHSAIAGSTSEHCCKLRNVSHKYPNFATGTTLPRIVHWCNLLQRNLNLDCGALRNQHHLIQFQGISAVTKLDNLVSTYTKVSSHALKSSTKVIGRFDFNSVISWPLQHIVETWLLIVHHNDHL